MYRLLKGLQTLFPNTVFVAALGADLWEKRKEEFGWDELKREFPLYRSVQDRTPILSSTAVRSELARGVVPASLNGLISNYLVAKQLYGLPSTMEGW